VWEVPSTKNCGNARRMKALMDIINCTAILSA
jgi:hypothetical protein